MNNVLNIKFVTPIGNGVRLTSAFVGGFSLWESLQWSGDYLFLGGDGGPGSMQDVVFHVKL